MTANDGGALTTSSKSNLKLALKSEPARAVIELLPNEIQDHIANQADAMCDLYNDVKRNDDGLSNIQSDATNDNDLTAPYCLPVRMMKNPLNGIKLVQGTAQFE